MNKLLLSCLLILSTCLPACVSFAPPAPMLTYGGPETTPKGSSEMAIAIGTGVALFDGAHTGAQGWFGRYKYGISDQLDLGIDALGAKRNEGLFLSIKGAARYQIQKNTRVELGIGVADDSDGKSINGDLALTIGTIRKTNWNYYSSLRLSYAKGYPGNAILGSQTPLSQDTIVPPNTFMGLINIGAQGKISDHQKFIFEGGYGYIFPEGEKSAPAFYLSVGLLFNIGTSAPQ